MMSSQEGAGEGGGGGGRGEGEGRHDELRGGEKELLWF